jgi:hypothetical protein
LLEFAYRGTEIDRLLVVKAPPVLENVSEKDARNCNRAHFALMRLGPLAVRRGQKVDSAPEGQKSLLIDVGTKSFVIDAIAINNLRTAIEAKTSRSIRPPFLVESGSSKKSLRAAGHPLNGILSNTIGLLNSGHAWIHRPAKLGCSLGKLARAIAIKILDLAVSALIVIKMSEGCVTRLIFTSITFEIVGGDICNHKSSGLAVDSAVEFAFGNKVVSSHMVTEIDGIPPGRRSRSSMVQLLYSDSLTSGTIVAFVFVVKGMKLCISQKTPMRRGIRRVMSRLWGSCFCTN